MPAAYGAGFVSFLPLRGKWRRRKAGDSAGTGAWSDLVPVRRWEECKGTGERGWGRSPDAWDELSVLSTRRDAHG